MAGGPCSISQSVLRTWPYIIKIVYSNEVNGSSQSGASQQIGLSQNKSHCKKFKKFGPSYQHKWQGKDNTPIKGGIQGGIPPNVGHKEDDFVISRQTMFVLRMECLKGTLCYQYKTCWCRG